MPELEKLKTLVDYRVNSIVSRAIVDKPCGTVTAFAFEKGQALSEHIAPYDALVVVIEGEAEITIRGEKFAVKSGEMIIMPADIPHAIKAKKAFKMLLVMIRA